MVCILLIDDDDQVRTSIRKFLVREGYDVVEAPDGKAGMRFFQQKRVDLVITDIIMPEKEGIETIIELRRHFPEVKIIAISGGGCLEPDGYLNVAQKVGAHRIFAKPFELEDLLASVRQLLE
jgi:DNA-binding response OmpR family regulator